MALVLHELTTNAVKYGCLSTVDGALSLDWEIRDNLLKINWSERGVSDCKPPVKTGFGTTLAKTTIERQFGGSIAYDWRPGGLSVAITTPIATVSCEPVN